MKVMVGLSGGVDSSVAALLLLRQGVEVEALFMRNWDAAANHDLYGNPDLNADICPQETDYNDAIAVADKLGIKLHRHDFVDEYWENVFQFFLQELAQGRTPNPDILCNKFIKFQAFLDVSKALGADMIAMGHYARVDHGPTHRLLRGVDTDKDQTYFLCQLNQTQLQNVLFPVGDLTKQAVRKIATDFGLSTASKKDSTGICFIGERRFSQFLTNYLPSQPGQIVAEDGQVIGTHQGLMNYTIGQRKGLQIGGSKQYESLPWFVSGKNLSTNTLHVVQGFHHPRLYSNRAIVHAINWIDQKPADNEAISAKFRYRQKDIPVTISYIDHDTVEVMYPEKARAVTPGQACVFYKGDECLGGGTIDQVYMNERLMTED